MARLHNMWSGLLNLLSHPAMQGAGVIIGLLACILTFYLSSIATPQGSNPTTPTVLAADSSPLAPSTTQTEVAPISAETATSLIPTDLPTVAPTNTTTSVPTKSATATQATFTPTSPATATIPTLTLASTPSHIPTIENDLGILKSVGEVYEANGIAITLTGYDITSDGTVWLTFSVANRGSNDALLRYENSYFSVNDDTGRTYSQVNELLTERKQVSVPAGRTVNLSSDRYPESTTEISNFSGKTSENATYLVVKVSQFADLRDMQWRIPLNAQTASPQSPVPNTQQQIGAGFAANGITILLIDYDIGSDGTIWLRFRIRNEGSNAVLLRYQNKYFDLSDDIGNNYPQVQELLSEPKQLFLQPGKSFDLASDRYPESTTEISNFSGKTPENATHLVVKISQFADLRDMQWIIPLK